MANRRNFRSTGVAIAMLALAGILWQSTWADKPENKAAKNDEAPARATAATLGGPERYLTHLSTDKPIYRPGEKIYMRGVMLHHATHTPQSKDAGIGAMVEIEGPKGDTVAGGYVTLSESVLGYSWEIPEGQAGGEYTVHVTYPGFGFAPAERKFDIRNYRPPRLKSQIKFLRDGYGPGDQVAATLNVERAEGGIPADAKVTVVARVDGQETYRGATQVDDQGNCQARFSLPKEILRGEGTLAMIIEDGGVVETASKTIPILLQTVDLTMYPEGGELVAGLANRVYFEAFTPAHKPADLAGAVVDANGKELATFRSAHEGRGHFEFTPAAGEKYELKITEPAGIKTRYPLPDAKDQGVVLRAVKDTYVHGEPVELQIAATDEMPISVTISKREKEIAKKTVQIGDKQSAPAALPGKPFELSIQLPDSADGVLIATAWGKDGQPLAERLIFRQPAHQINVKVTADAARYVPGGKAKLNIQTTTAEGKPIGAMVGVTVTDDSVLEMIERREQAPRLPVMVLLENDVRELADAHVYLDPNNPDAPQAVDLLLGTQGWRRFALVRVAELLEKHDDLARRALALRLVEQCHPVAPGGFPVDAVIEAAEVLELAAPPQAAAPPELDEKPQEGREAQDKAKNVDAPAGEPAPENNADRQQIAGKPRAAQGSEFKAEQQQLRQMAEKLQRRKRNLKIAADEEFEGDRADFADAIIARNDFVPVRVYAHEVRTNRQPGQRIDFTETLFWHAGIQTDAETGTATVEFGLNDSVTSFRVAADAFGPGGALGSGTTAVESVEPFYLEPKLPLEVTSGDKILLPLGVVNATDKSLTGLHIDAQTHAALNVQSNIVKNGTIDADARIRHMLPVEVGSHNGAVDFSLSAFAGSYSDRVTRQLTIRPQGFPIEVGLGGLVGPGDTVTHEIVIPAEVVAKSTASSIAVYPTPLASMTEALTRLIREPNGCFEQTSSSTYPLIMAQQYFMSHQGVDPELVQRSSKLLAKGYDRLKGFECKNGGFEWFGQDPGHEALTAYGLLEFTDMSKVAAVDSAMIDRTRKWLLAHRDGKGEFARKRRALHTWITEPECSNAYITWALLEAGVRDGLDKEVAWVRRAGESSSNTYAIALSANVLALAGDDEGANHLMDKLSGRQQADGSLDGATMSIVGSGGEALKIEATSLAMMAWLKNPRYATNVERGIKYLAESCKAGRFGSTQSTVLALRAIVAYDQSRAKPKAPGYVQLLIDGQPIGDPVKFTKDTQGAIRLPDATKLLSPGRHKVQVKMTNGSEMPYSVALNYNTLKPNTSRDVKLHLQCKLSDSKVEEGAVTEAQVVVVNHTNEAVPSTVAIIGIPGGLEVRHDQLKELVKAEKIAAYEVLGRDVVLYWRSLKAEERVELPISLIAAVPGTYTGPASRAYLYYTDEHKFWTDGLTVDITPRAER